MKLPRRQFVHLAAAAATLSRPASGRIRLSLHGKAQSLLRQYDNRRAQRLPWRQPRPRYAGRLLHAQARR